MKRDVIKIDEDKCTGCGLCIPNCPEGALQLINGKVRLISDLFCDGLGACIGHCPEDAITIEKREAEEYDEEKVMGNIIKAGKDVVVAHLKHLKDHGQTKYLEDAISVLKKKKIEVPDFEEKPSHHVHECGCPGSAMRDMRDDVQEPAGGGADIKLKPELRQWPVQLQLLNPAAPYFDNAELVISADCVPFAYPDFHRKFLKGKILVILCPKLDQVLDEYVDKLAEIFKTKNIKSVSIVHMEVPCCFGVGSIVEEALRKSGKNVMMKDYTVSIKGEII